eukprot:COSAG02_NODE_6279_length_3682_cov_1.790957_2_plen_1002_part_01
MVFVATLLSCGTAGQWDTYCEWIDASGHAVIPHWMTRIGTRAGNQGTLMGCDNLTTVSIPNTVSLIGRSAFRFSGLESIVIPDSVTNIDNFAFGGCSTLVLVVIPDSVTRIGRLAFPDQPPALALPTSVTSVEYGNSGPHLCGGDPSLGFPPCPTLTAVSLSVGATEALTCTTSIGTTATYEIAPTGALVTLTFFSSAAILPLRPACAFMGLTPIFASNISTSSTGVEWMCTDTIPQHSSRAQSPLQFVIGGPVLGVTTSTDNTSVLTVGELATSGAMELIDGAGHAEIPCYCSSIGVAAFSSLGNLQSVFIPDSVESIGDRAFSGCSSLTAVTIPDSVSGPVGAQAFKDCSALGSVTISNNVSGIGDGAFEGCISLVSIVIPDSVESIGDRAFSGCSSLSFLRLGSSVTSIDQEAFWMTDLKSIAVGTSTTSLHSAAFPSNTLVCGDPSLGQPPCQSLDLVSISGNDNPASCRVRSGDSITLTFTTASRLESPWCMFGVISNTSFANDRSHGMGTSWACSYIVSAEDEAADAVLFSLGGPVLTSSVTTDGSSLSTKTCTSFSATHSAPYPLGYAVANPAATMQCLLGLSCTAGFSGIPSATCTADGAAFAPLGGCTPCEAGQYADVNGLEHCIWCPIGKYMYSSISGSNTERDCVACEVGKYGMTTGSIDASSCIDCPMGRYNQALNSTGCIDCPAGMFASSPGSFTCDSCAGGRYSAVAAAISNSSCLCCQAGKTSPENSSSADDCVDCGAGRWRAATCVADNSLQLCVDCASDMYGVVPGQTSSATACIQCPAHSSTVGRTGVSRQQDCWCTQGYEMTYGMCRPCPPNTYSPVVSADRCFTCPLKSVTAGVTGASCVSQCVCVAGYSPDSATYGHDCVTGTCAACPQDFFKTDVGQSDCIACPANAISPRSSTSIIDCACNAASGYTGGPIENWCDQCVRCLPTQNCSEVVPPNVTIQYTGNTLKVSPSARVLLQSSGTRNYALRWSGSRILSNCNLEP